MNFKLKNAGSVTKVVERLSDLLGNHFGVAVQYIPVEPVAGAVGLPGSTLASNATARALETAKRNASAPMIVAHNQMIIPMRVEGSLVGATHIQKINKLRPGQLSQIKDTVDLILNEVLSADRRLEHINAVEEFLEKENSNVISLSERKLAAAAASRN